MAIIKKPKKWTWKAQIGNTRLKDFEERKEWKNKDKEDNL